MISRPVSIIMTSSCSPKSPHPKGIIFGSIQCLTSCGLVRLSKSGSVSRLVSLYSLRQTSTEHSRVMTPPASRTGPEADEHDSGQDDIKQTNDNGGSDVLVVCLVETVEHKENAAKEDQEEATRENEEN